MQIQYFIFNYAHFKEAMGLYEAFTSNGCDTYLINCAFPMDPPFEETDRIRKFPNIYYSGQWNEALKLLTGDVLFIINADVRIKSVSRLVRKMTDFYEMHASKAALYAPNVNWTPWTYDPKKLEDIGNGIKKVPATDSTIWSVSADIAHKIGPMDLAVNKLGWGIEVLAAFYASLENRLVVRDYSIRCSHPQHTAYDRHAADKEWRRMVEKMKLGKEFWRYYDSRNKYGFGWKGNDNPELFEVKKLLML